MKMRVAMALLAGLVATAAVSEEKAAPKSEPAAAPKAESAAPAPSSALADEEKLSYALGMDLAAHFQKQSVVLNPDAFARGMKDILAGGSTALTEQEARALITGLQAEMRKKFEAERQAAAEKAKVEGEKAKAEGEAYLATNKAKPGVVTLPSGLQYEVLKEGAGAKPTLENTVECQYRGTLVNGTEFDSSYARNQPASFPVKGVIKGWTEALQLMPVGSKWRLVIPAQLAYGERGAGPIPPNSTLVFELELLGIK
jgi:FKBP-type peptidyl-prolyl cis-trans isomerase FklB